MQWVKGTKQVGYENRFGFSLTTVYKKQNRH